uniref:Receptor ligand binding region domain-containing protein n=1 Tax=Panagrolaimus sp. ES5 TaxID=591445 RepID=A0AC34GXH3_9BILA
MIHKNLVIVINFSLILLLFCCCYAYSKPYSTKIGTILFENRHSHFRAIISATRSFLDLHLSLNKISIDDTHVIFLKTGNIHDVVKAVKYLKSENVSLIIGPPENDFGDFVQLFCTEQRILYLSYYFDPQGGISPFIYRLFPSSEHEKMVNNLIKYWRWNRFTVVYSKSHSLRNVHQFIVDSKADIVFVEVNDETDEINKFIESGLQMRNICNFEECWRYTNKAILELSAEKSYRFLEASLMLGLINSQNWFYLFSLDNTEHGMESFSHNTMRLSVAGQFDEHMLNNNGTYKPLIKAYKQKLKKDQINKTDITDLVRFHDALLSIPIILPKMSQKLSLQKKVIFGLTGKISFDEQRMRADAAFHVLEMGVDGNQINTGLWYTNSKQLERVLSMTDKTLANTHE